MSKWTDNFRHNLKEMLAKREMSQQELSRKSGIHWVTISRILGGVNDPSVETAQKLASAAGFSSPKIFSEL